MKKRLLILVNLIYLSVNFLSASNNFGGQEDTLRNNFMKQCQPRQPLILHAALEGPNAIVGGLGTVMRDLGNKIAEKLPNSFVINPYYSFLMDNPKINTQVKSLGFFKHSVFDRLITTEVFLNESNNQLLFSPSSSIVDCIKIVKDKDSIYESTQNFLRIIYFNSSVAKFSNLVNTDVIQLHAWHTSLTVALIKKKYNPQRIKNNLKEIKVIATLHMFNEEQGIDSGSIYEFVGLKRPKDDTVNLAATAILESDCLTTVSEGLTTYFTNPLTSYGLSKLFDDKQGFIYGITNGIDYAKFNPFLESNLGHLALKNNFSCADLKHSKMDAKQLLWDNNLVASPTKPLMLYVGRFSDEKGNAFLPAIIKKWLKMGGQIVLMGIYTQDKISTAEIESLIEQCNSNPLLHDNLKIFTNLEKDQLSPISQDIKIQKGKLIRYAADFVCIPSKVESCGLVSMESLSFGTPVFTSWVQGLKDMCFPYNVYHPILKSKIDESNFNSVSFEFNKNDKTATLREIKINLAQAYELVSGKKIDQNSFLSAQKRMIESANRFDWNACNGAVQKYEELYLNLIGDTIQLQNFTLYPETIDNDHLVQTIVSKLNGYPVIKTEFRYDMYQPFLMTTLNNGKREKENRRNFNYMKEQSRVKFRDGKVYANGSESILLDTDAQINANENFYKTYVINKKGSLFVGSFCHAYFLKSTPGKPNFGYAKPVACAGDIIFKNGKITYIDNRSGHYRPTTEQFLIGLYYIDSMQLLEENCVIKNSCNGEQIDISTVRQLDIFEILSRYPTLEEVSIPKTNIN